MFNKLTIKHLGSSILKNKSELGFAIFGLSALMLAATVLFYNPNTANDTKALNEALKKSQEETLALSLNLKQFYLLERDLIEAGASQEQAVNIIKSTEILDDSDLARSQSLK